MAFKIFLLIGFAAIVSADLSHYSKVVRLGEPELGHELIHHSYEVPSKYDFSYGVHDSTTGDIKSAQETRVGDTVLGSYSVVDPDGFKRTVDYHADAETGFKAEVKREPLLRSFTHVETPVLKKVATIEAEPLPYYRILKYDALPQLYRYPVLRPKPEKYIKYIKY